MMLSLARLDLKRAEVKPSLLRDVILPSVILLAPTIGYSEATLVEPSSAKISIIEYDLVEAGLEFHVRLSNSSDRDICVSEGSPSFIIARLVDSKTGLIIEAGSEPDDFPFAKDGQSYETAPDDDIARKVVVSSGSSLDFLAIWPKARSPALFAENGQGVDDYTDRGAVFGEVERVLIDCAYDEPTRGVEDGRYQTVVSDRLLLDIDVEDLILSDQASEP